MTGDMWTGNENLRLVALAAGRTITVNLRANGPHARLWRHCQREGLLVYVDAASRAAWSVARQDSVWRNPVPTRQAGAPP